MDQATILTSAESHGDKSSHPLFACVSNEMLEVESLLQSQLQSKYEDLQPIFAHGALLGGKRMRPALVLLSGKLCGNVHDAHVLLGTVMEMVHTATLIHDDVLDNASKRRHIATINARWNEHTSILLGDYLFAQAFTLAATLERTDACRWIGDAARKVCEGELRQVLSRGVADITEDEYYDIIRGKTAELCRVSCKLGASASHAPGEWQRRLAKFGDALGIAFQITDDYLDLWGQADGVGKTLGTDLDQGKATLPLIRLLETSKGSERDSILEVLAMPPKDRSTALMPLLEESDAKEYTLQQSRHFAEAAMSALDAFPDSEAKTTLMLLSEFAVTRSP